MRSRRNSGTLHCRDLLLGRLSSTSRCSRRVQRPSQRARCKPYLSHVKHPVKQRMFYCSSRHIRIFLHDTTEDCMRHMSQKTIRTSAMMSASLRVTGVHRRLAREPVHGFTRSRSRARGAVAGAWRARGCCARSMPPTRTRSRTRGETTGFDQENPSSPQLFLSSTFSFTAQGGHGARNHDR